MVNAPPAALIRVRRASSRGRGHDMAHQPLILFAVRYPPGSDLAGSGFIIRLNGEAKLSVLIALLTVLGALALFAAIYCVRVFWGIIRDIGRGRIGKTLRRRR